MSASKVYSVGNAWLGDADGHNADARLPLITALLERVREGLVQDVELVNVHLLKRMRRAELVCPEVFN